MSSPIVYIIDSSALIDLKEFYSEDTHPGLWEMLAEFAKDGRLKCPREVYREIKEKNLDLAVWLKNNGAVIPDNETAALIQAVTQIDKKYPDLKKGSRSSLPKPQSADPWVVALAAKDKATVICTERSRPASQTVTQIPDVCRKENIRCFNLIEWFKELGLKFYIIK